MYRTVRHLGLCVGLVTGVLLAMGADLAQAATASAEQSSASNAKLLTTTPIAIKAESVAYAPHWRYRYHNGRWWYWTPNNYWMYYGGGRWYRHGAYAGYGYGPRYGYGYRYPYRGYYGYRGYGPYRGGYGYGRRYGTGYRGYYPGPGVNIGVGRGRGVGIGIY
jgi:hypothetical protein